MGAYRELELTLLSARDLKNVNLITRMDVYAVASISGDPMTRQCTPPDYSGGRNPCWDITLRFSVPASAAAAGGGWLHVLLRSERALGDRDIGEVVVPLAELLAGADGPAQQPPRLASYQVHTVHRGEPRGVLNVSYRLGPVVAPVKRADGEKSPVIAYPAPPPQQQQFQPQNGGSYYRPQQPFQPQNPQQPFQLQNPQQQYHRPRDAYPPPSPRHYEDRSPRKTTGDGNGPTQVCVGPHTQIILSAPAAAPPPRSNTIPAKKADEPRPKPSYVPPQQSNASLGKTDYSRPKSYPQQHDTQVNRPNVSPTKFAAQEKTDYSRAKSFPQQHDTKVNWPNVSPPKLAQEKTHHSQANAFPQHVGAQVPNWPNVSPPKLAQEKAHHSTPPKAPPQQDTQAGSYAPNRPIMSPKKPDPSRHEAPRAHQGTQTQVREYASTQSNIHTGKADSRPKEAYAPTRPNNTPGKTDQSGPKVALERMPRMPTAAAR